MTSHKLWLLFIIYVYSATCELHRKVIFPLPYGLHVYLYIKEGGREGGGGGWGCTGIRGQGFHQDRVQVVQGLPGTCLNVLNAQLSCLYKTVKSWEYAEN